MSTIPGYSLEKFVAWNHNLIVDGVVGVNVSLSIVEAFGIETNRIQITQEQFKPILDLYEPYREQAENLLLDFDDETQSWRDYSSCIFDRIPDTVLNEAVRLVKELQGKN